MDQTTILIVDDEPRVLDALEAVLAAEFRVLRASSGPAALDLLRAEDVAVILTDYKMPGMTGVEMLRECQTIAPDAVRLVLLKGLRQRPVPVDPQLENDRFAKVASKAALEALSASAGQRPRS